MFCDVTGWGRPGGGGGGRDGRGMVELAFKGLEILFVVETETKAGICTGAWELESFCDFLPLFLCDDGVDAATGDYFFV